MSSWGFRAALSYGRSRIRKEGQCIRVSIARESQFTHPEDEVIDDKSGPVQMGVYRDKHVYKGRSGRACHMIRRRVPDRKAG